MTFYADILQHLQASGQVSCRGESVEILQYSSRDGRGGKVKALVCINDKPEFFLKFSRVGLSPVLKEEFDNMNTARRLFPDGEESPLPAYLDYAEIAGRAVLVTRYFEARFLSEFFASRLGPNLRNFHAVGTKVVTWLRRFAELDLPPEAGEVVISREPSRRIPFSTGPMHGDFLCRNVGVSRNGVFKVVDWPAFSMRGTPEIDLIAVILDLALFALNHRTGMIRECFVPGGLLFKSTSELMRLYCGPQVDEGFAIVALDKFFEYTKNRVPDVTSPKLATFFESLKAEFDSCRASIQIRPCR